MAVTDLGDIDSGLRSELGTVLRLRRLRQRASGAVAFAVVLALVAVPLVNDDAFNLERTGVALAYVMAAIGLNLAFGYAGELVIGQSAIMAAGAYAAGILSAKFGIAAPIAIPVATAAGTLLGILTMLPGLRVQGWYLALITMFSVLVMPHVVELGDAWTGGEYGLTGITAIEIFGLRFGDVAVYELIVLSFALIWGLTANFVRSGWGYRLRGLRDARRAAEAVGIGLTETRFVVYVLSAVPASLAGALLAYSQRFVNPDSFALGLTLLLLTGVVLGGAGTIWGPLVGMAPLLALSFWVGPFSEYNAVVLGFALLIGVLVFTDGVVPAFGAAVQSWFGPRQPSSGAAPAPAAVDVPPRPVSTSALTKAPADAALRARSVVKRFGGVLALDHVDFELAPGKLCGLVGPNGSGKSTFLNAISGFYPVDAGEIEIGGIDVAGWTVHRIARTGVGRTFQVPQLVDELTALENIEMGIVGSEPRALIGSLFYTPAVARLASERREKALAALAMVGLPPDSVGKPVEKLPLGLKRTVEVGRAVASFPKLLLLDEPAAGLNEAERAELGLLLRKLRDAGITILVVEHNVPFIMGTCDEIVLLENGQITCRADLGGPLPERLTSYLNYAPADSRRQDA